MDAIISMPNSKSQKVLAEEVVGDGKDIISTLPDNILLYILSFLHIKDVLKTSALSTRWKHLWKCILEIDFDEFHCLPLETPCGIRTSFLDSVERILLLHDCLIIRKFRLKLRGDICASRVNTWVSTVVSQKVQEVDLNLRSETLFVLPDNLFTCESLSTLKLDLLFEVPSLIHFSNLKILSLRVTFPGDQFAEQLFSGCPVLQELSLHDCVWKNNKRITISIPTLKKLSICGLDDGTDDVYDCVITIYAENLLSLECINFLKSELLLCNLRSLVTAYIDEINWETETYAERAIKLFRGIRNVKFLTLPEMTLECLSTVNNLQACLPTFHSLTHFKVECGFDSPNSDALMCFLQKSPNLESLEIPEVFYPIEDWLLQIVPQLNIVPQCFSSCLKTVAISIHEEDDEIPFLKYLLENAKMLERIKIFCVDSSTIDFVQQEINHMSKANRMGSMSCLIEFSEICYCR